MEYDRHYAYEALEILILEIAKRAKQHNKPMTTREMRDMARVLQWQNHPLFVEIYRRIESENVHGG